MSDARAMQVPPACHGTVVPASVIARLITGAPRCQHLHIEGCSSRAAATNAQVVEEWLEHALANHGSGTISPCAKCSCISGPTGCGRATTLQLLAKVRCALQCMSGDMLGVRTSSAGYGSSVRGRACPQFSGHCSTVRLAVFTILCITLR